MASKKSGDSKRPKRVKRADQFAKIEAAASQIHATAGKLRTNPRLKEGKSLPVHAEALHQEILNLFGKKGGDDNQTPSLNMDQFFTGVATSLISAQKGLDAHSADYIKEVSGTQFLLPSIFRIPKLSAEMKFAVNTADEKGVNLFFFKNVTTEQSSNQQTVQFDIVSAPLPPDIPRSPVLVAVVLDGDTRGTVLTKVNAPPWTPASANNVVIYQINNGEYVLSFADATNVGLWYANLNDTGAQAVLRPFSAVGLEAEPFRATVLALGQQQANFLRSRT